MASEWPWSTAAAEQLRLQFTRNICDAVQGFGLDGFVDFFAARKDSSPKWVKSLLPMAMAATGNVAVMTEVTTRGCTDIRGVFAIKPNVLKAAIAANQADIVDRILYFLATNTQGPRITGDWEEMRMVAREIGEALKVAVRMYRYEIGLLITGFLKRNWRTLGRSVHWSLVREIADCCIQYGNTGLFNTLSYWKRTGELPNSGTDLSYKMTKGEFTFIIRRGMSCLMRHIVKSGMVDPNLIEGEAPLWLALSARRYRMAKVLVEEGADMDRVPPGKNLTAYHHACDSYKRDDQYYLVLWGADTRPMHEHGTPWDPADKAKKVYIEEQGLHGWGEGEYISVENHVPEIQI